MEASARWKYDWRSPGMELCNGRTTAGESACPFLCPDLWALLVPWRVSRRGHDGTYHPDLAGRNTDVSGIALPGGHHNDHVEAGWQWFQTNDGSCLE